MPGPVSSTVTSTCPSTAWTRTATVPPSGVNLMELVRRFHRTCCSRLGSPVTGPASASTFEVSVTPLDSAAGRTVSRAARITATGSTACISTRMVPATIREMSSRSAMRRVCDAGVPQDRVEGASGRRLVDLLFAEDVRPSEHGAEWRAQLVGDGGEEGVLEAAGLAQALLVLPELVLAALSPRRARPRAVDDRSRGPARRRRCRPASRSGTTGRRPPRGRPPTAATARASRVTLTKTPSTSAPAEDRRGQARPQAAVAGAHHHRDGEQQVGGLGADPGSQQPAEAGRGQHGEDADRPARETWWDGPGQGLESTNTGVRPWPHPCSSAQSWSRRSSSSSPAAGRNARAASLAASLPISAPASTLNRKCMPPYTRASITSSSARENLE